MNYQKKFSIGLPVLDSVDVFNSFLDKYSAYIENIYFSVPLGDRFHSRIVTQKVLRESGKKQYFVDLLRCVQNHNIKLELLFNTANLLEQDIVDSKAFLDYHNIEPDLIGILDEYYDIVHKYYPNKEYVYSFNNFPKNSTAFLSIPHVYNQYVVGRNCIRDTDLFKNLKEKKGQVVLLLNNGCSFVCGGCKDKFHCHDAYYKERRTHSSEYMYALQSIWPFELNDGYLDVSNIDYYKIASRNANVQYIKECLDSYILNQNDVYDTQNYALWSRLSWHYDYFNEFSKEHIIEIKRRIYNHTIGEVVNQTLANEVALEIDLTDGFTITGQPIDKKAIETTTAKLFESITDYKKVPITIIRAYLGCNSCERIMDRIDLHKLAEQIRALHKMKLKVAFVFPSIETGSTYRVDEILKFLKFKQSSPDELVVNDERLLKHLWANTSLPIALGRNMHYFSDDYSTLSLFSDDSSRERAIDLLQRNWLENHRIAYIMCDMKSKGLWISAKHKKRVKVLFPKKVVEKNCFCQFNIDDNCQMECLTYNSNLNRKHFGKNVYENINMTNEIRSSLLEQKYVIVVSLL